MVGTIVVGSPNLTGEPGLQEPSTGIPLGAVEVLEELNAYVSENLDGGAPFRVGDYEPQDSTGDGLFNDFDGDGDTTHDDVSAFFEHLEDDAVQNNPDLFDFDENDRVGFGDVLDLLRRI